MLCRLLVLIVSALLYSTSAFVSRPLTPRVTPLAAKKLLEVPEALGVGGELRTIVFGPTAGHSISQFLTTSPYVRLVSLIWLTKRASRTWWLVLGKKIDYWSKGRVLFYLGLTSITLFLSLLFDKFVWALAGASILLRSLRLYLAKTGDVELPKYKQDFRAAGALLELINCFFLLPNLKWRLVAGSSLLLVLLPDLM